MPEYVVRYGAMRLLGIYSTSAQPWFARGTRVVVRTERGLEVGEILCEVTGESVAGLPTTNGGEILRPVQPEDQCELQHIRQRQGESFDVAVRIIGQLGLAMHLVDVEHLFGGERIIFYYVADGRIDFRELVRLLAAELQTRVEMRQIGVRDEAKLLADFGDCGKAVCCNSHLVEMPPVSMKMAKLQKATLDPTKISGRCGRLKCCLRFEYETYEQLQKELPPVGARVQIAEGLARVVGHDILAGKLLVESDQRVRKLVAVTEATLVAPLEQVVSRSENG